MDRPRIHVLPPEVASRIAAGEVVERPASVVKELVENALDAGATAIDVEIREGGLTYIRVADNGMGIPRADLPLVFERFATSKIRRAEDLAAIRTFGFRGEALSAIASVAEVEILTRAEGEAGTRARALPARPPIIEPAAAPVGTQVVVRNLFAQVPARRKFLKSPLREADLVHQVVVRYALAFPEVAMRLTINGRAVLSLPKATPVQRIGQVLGREIADHMLEIQWEAGDLRVHGWISSPQVSRATRERQFFTVNRRPIRSGLLAVVLERPYAGRLPPGRKPVAVVDIALDPRFVDVNVHPRKAEVRFAQERSVYWALARAVEAALAPFPVQQVAETGEWPFAGVEEQPAQVAEERRSYASVPRALSQLHHTYILAQDEHGLLLVDQHAAHEQVIFERLWAAAGEPSPLSPPVLVHLTPREADALGTLVPVLSEVGIVLEPFGANTFSLRALPAPLLQADPAVARAERARALVNALLEEAHAYARLSPEALKERLAARAACFVAVKAGDVLDPDRQQALLHMLWEAWSPATCPHGRPAFVALSLEEIEQRFQRR